jgi:type I site-specific restriction-modification system R (restriction) subunit
VALTEAEGKIAIHRKPYFWFYVFKPNILFFVIFFFILFLRSKNKIKKKITKKITKLEKQIF